VRLSRDPKDRTQAAVESLYRRYVGDVYRYALAITGDSSDAEDVTQTTFLNALRAIERGKEVRNPKAWLRTIAHNLCRQRFRQASRQPSQVPFDEDVGDLVVENEGPTADDVARALKHLPFNQRSALVMRELEGRSPREIAQALGVTLSATETLLFRARRSLREQLEGSLTCAQAEKAISLRADKMLDRSERGALRAHLRECPECAHAARSVRAQRGALKSLAAIPLPPALGLFSGLGSSAGGGAVVGSAFGKVAIAGVAAALVAGTSYEAVSHHAWPTSRPDAQHATAQVRPAAHHGVSRPPARPAQPAFAVRNQLVSSHAVPARKQAHRHATTRSTTAHDPSAAPGHTKHPVKPGRHQAAKARTQQSAKTPGRLVAKTPRQRRSNAAEHHRATAPKQHGPKPPPRPGGKPTGNANGHGRQTKPAPATP
jgi:RNA polymerase sigma factor (sigma-70 family)